MCGAIPPLPNTSSWRGAQFKKSKGTTLHLPLITIIKTKREKICLSLVVTIPSDRNVIQKKTEKKLKCKNRSIEIQRMWNMKCFFIPVVSGATGVVTKGLKISENYQENM
jgi:hypothetical protein